MAVTAGGTPYVESSDLVANYPAVSLALAEHIDDLPSTILQVVSATKKDTFTTTSTTLVDVTGLSVSVTPASATNKILVFATLSMESLYGSYQQVWGNVLRDSTSLGGTAEGTRPSGTFWRYYYAGGQGTNPTTFITLDSPATTSATTYKIQVAARAGSTAGINMLNSNGDQTFNPRMASSITVIEVAA
jgi:hypothetical protein